MNREWTIKLVVGGLLCVAFATLVHAIASGAEIVGPQEPIRKYQLIQLTVEDVPIEALKGCIVETLPEAGCVCVPIIDWRGKPSILFYGEQPGAFSVRLYRAVEKDVIEKAVCKIVVEGENGPDPPLPDPPTPDPPDKLTAMWVIVVEESKDRTAKQAQVLLDSSLRNWLSNNGHTFRLVDKDQPASDVRGWIVRAEGHDLPRVFLVQDNDGNAETVWEGPLPGSKAEMLKLVKEWGAEK